MSIIQTTKTLRPRDDFDHYPTPIGLVEAALLKRIAPLFDGRGPVTVLDPGAGTGVWGQVARALWPNAYIVGTEIRPDCPNPGWYDLWLTGNHMEMEFGAFPCGPFQLVIGNPPYGDLWKLEQRKLAAAAKKRGKKYKRPPRPASAGPVADAEAFVRKSLADTMPGGYVLFLLRLAFLEGQDRASDLWKAHCPLRVSTLGKRPSYTGNGKTDATAYATFLWQAGEDHYRDWYRGDWLEWR